MANDDGTPNLLSGWLSLLGNRLLLALLAVSLIPLALTGIAMYNSAAATIRTQAFGQLETVRTITAKSVERYFTGLQDQLRVVSEDRMTVDAVRQFKTAVTTLAADTKADEKSLDMCIFLNGLHSIFSKSCSEDNLKTSVFDLL